MQDPKFSRRHLAAIGARLEKDVAASIIPGAMIVLGNRDQVAYQHAAGLRDVSTGDALRTDAIWRIYSMTKPIVTVAAMVLVEAGLLSCDQPVADYIPSFARLRVADGQGRDVPAQRSPTIQDLMRHTAGISYGYLGDSQAHRTYVADGFLEEDLSNTLFADRLAALPLEHQPGTVWHYSHAPDVLGRVLEVITGHSLRQVLQTTLFEPLNMRETDFQVPAAKRGRVAEPLPGPTGRPRFFDPCLPRRGERGGGGLASTAYDYGRFLRMLLGKGSLDGTRILSSATIAYMTADHLGQSIRKASYYPPGPGYGFGLGFAVRLVDGEAPFPGTRGDYFWSGVGGTYFWVDPVRNFFVLIMLQSSSPEQRRHYRTLLRNMVYAALDF